MGLIADIRAIKKIQRIKNGGSASISVSSITNIIINLPDANRTLTKDEYEKVYAIYEKMRKCKTPIDMDINGYYKTAISILLEFDKIAPCESYLGMEPFEANLLMREVRSIAPLCNPKESYR